MSIEVMSRVWKDSKREGTELLLLLAIADYADDHGVAHPYKAQLAKKCRISERTVQRLLKKIEDEGELEIRRADGRGNRMLLKIKSVKESAKKGDISCTEKGDNLTPFKGKRETSGASKRKTFRAPYHIPSLKKEINTTHHDSFLPADPEKSGADAPEEKNRECVNSLPSIVTPTLTEFTENYLTEKLLSWCESHCPLVGPQRSTAEFLAYHEGEGTEFTDQKHLLKSWRGWMRNAQRIASERAEIRAMRQSNEQTRTGNRESTNLRNLRETVEFFGAPTVQPIRSREAMRAFSAANAERARAASAELIRKSIERYGAGRNSQ